MKINSRARRPALAWTPARSRRALAGSFTALAQKNFQISGLTAPKVFRRALGMVKFAAAQTNEKLRVLSKKNSAAIQKAAQEFMDGKFDRDFDLDVFQAGAGTSWNMNANEIIANRANEIGSRLGEAGSRIHPNDHVNRSQSTNDVIPTALRIAALRQMPNLLDEIKKLAAVFLKLGKKYKNLVKVGRTHLMDAVPTTLGKEFSAYDHALQKSAKRIAQAAEELHELGIGATALGTGILTPKGYQKLMVKNLAKLSGLKLIPGSDLAELTHNYNVFVSVSGSLRTLAIDLIRIANDLKLLNMGPLAGIGEITLPEVQPGSSIMPGKVNPSIPECVEMVGYQVCGCDETIMLAAQRGQLDMNVMAPVITWNLLTSIEILTNAIRTFREKCVQGICVNRERIKELLDKSLCTTTELMPVLGYQKVAEIVKEALREKQAIKTIVLKQKLLAKKRFRNGTKHL